MCGGAEEETFGGRGKNQPFSSGFFALPNLLHCDSNKLDRIVNYKIPPKSFFWSVEIWAVWTAATRGGRGRERKVGLAGAGEKGGRGHFGGSGGR